MSDTFPRQYARTQRLTLGEPRNLTLVPTGSRVLFARSAAGDDPVNALWSADLETGSESLIADPRVLLDAADSAELPPEERARRERLREGAGGITGYVVDQDGSTAIYALGGQLVATDIAAASSVVIDVPGPVFDPRPSPDGDAIAYVRGRELWITDRAGEAHELVGSDADTVSWGSAEFIAAEEMGRQRGFWWSPDGESLAVCRVDTAGVDIWHIADPASPGRVPTALRYPAAGTANADVSLHIVRTDRSAPIEVRWDRERFPYLAHVSWTSHGLAVTVQSRNQRELAVMTADTTDGSTTTLWSDSDPVWVELVPGTGGLIDPETVVMCADRDGCRRLMIGDDIVSPVDVQVRAVVHASSERVVVTGNPVIDPTVLHVYEWSSGSWSALTSGRGMNTAVADDDTTVFRHAVLDEPGGRWRLPGGHALTSNGERPLVRPNVALSTGSAERPATAVLLPHGHDGSPLPVLLDPYGGPHAQRVVSSHQAYCASQWFADQGFAVVIADGRGTPGRGTAFERAVVGDLAGGVLDDQVDALHAAAERHDEIDLDRVAIRGWSFGGYLAALAVLDRPDVFHAAIAGAPVTEWRLYDTHYTERYLGDPMSQPEVYDASSLLPRAPKLSRPLLLIHGLADDNVVAAHTLQLSSALLAAGRAHEVLPLVGVTHMTPQENVAENLLLHQLDFLRRSLAGPQGN